MNRSPSISFFILIFACNSLFAGDPGSLSIVQHFQVHQSCFVENCGQLPLASTGGTAESIKYYSHDAGVKVYFMAGKISFVFTRVASENGSKISEATGLSTNSYEQDSPFLKGVGGFDPSKRLHSQPSKISVNRINLILLHSNPNAEILATELQEYYENYYTSGNADSGIINVHTYKIITYKDIYPHIDMVLHAQNGGMKYEFVVYPGGRVSDIQLQWNGLENIRNSTVSGIEYSFALGKMEESRPFSFQGPKEIRSAFTRKTNRISFKTGRYDKSKVLVIDPTLIWATYFGGSSTDVSNGITTDASGHVYITGYTSSTSGIASSAAYQTSFNGVNDVFIAKFDGSGTRLWSTYYGNNNGDNNGSSICTDFQENLYITGYTTSSLGIATTGAYQTSYAGGKDAFLAKFSNAGSLTWATYYGGGNDDYGYGVSAGEAGYVFISGYTESHNLIATSGAYQTTLGSSSNNFPDAFIARFTTSGQISWGTYYGLGALSYGISTDASGNAYITGSTSGSSGIATSGAFKTTIFPGYSDAFVAKFSSTGKLLWGTYFGGRGQDYGYGITTDPSGNICVAGYTQSYDGIATAGAYETVPINSASAFIAKFTGSGSILWSTYFCGTTGLSSGAGICSDATGNLYITGFISGNNLATSGAYQTSPGGMQDAFLAIFSGSGKRLWTTYYGGAGAEFGTGVCNDASGNIYITGSTTSTSAIATPGEFQTSFAGGNNDGFIAKFGNVSLINDAGISSILSPADSFCPASEIIEVRLKNFGNQELDSVKINWSVNKIAQKPYNWTGKLLADSTVLVTLGTYSFNSGMNTIKAWTLLPNGKADASAADDSAIQIIKVYYLPAATAGPDTTLCYNETYTMQGAGGIRYLWTPAKYLSNDTIANPKATLPNTELYTLLVTNKYGCSDSAHVLLKIRPRPVAGFAIANRQPYRISKGIQFQNQSKNALSYLWAFGDHITSDSANPMHIYTDSGDYKITLVAYGLGGCNNDTAYGYIHIINNDIEIYIPNSFTPNGDGINDFFDISGNGITGYTYDIYNRWGEHIFEGEPGHTAWNGTFRNIPVMEGIYIYKMDVIDILGYHHYLKGNITLTR